MPLYIIHRVVVFSKFIVQCNRSTAVFNRPDLTSNCRFIMTEPQNTFNAKKTKNALKQEKEKFGTYVVQRYVDYLTSYKKVLDRRFPRAMNMYRVFSVGIKDFYKDLKLYVSLRIKITKEQGFKNISRQNIELYYKMPNDMFRIVPVLILSAIPFGNYIIFPLAFLKPRNLLCSHFWSIQQRAEFSILDLQDRLKHNRPVFRALQAKVDSISDANLKSHFKKVIAMLGSGVHPNATDIISCKNLFADGPFNLGNLTYSHCGHLLKMHGKKKFIFRQHKLQYLAYILSEMDKAIVKEGGVENLNTEALRYACHLRGLNSTHLSNKDMIIWLEQWLNISKHVDKKSYSLLLHCPIFLAYNHPQNWVLIY